ncbi:hypothetical protein LshimejAT787_0404590 [Lyophyllum shimeji]|uniref:Uncharacterized protein n=1 Tax=Lyophyllum shimeji TaxID=47721 RepID=A0A9P3PK55_LYOSH|nr:hypothetical protein LshimejAT787_0404590 [Lyophyllum shimeji]
MGQNWGSSRLGSPHDSRLGQEALLQRDRSFWRPFAAFKRRRCKICAAEKEIGKGYSAVENFGQKANFANDLNQLGVFAFLNSNAIAGTDQQQHPSLSTLVCSGTGLPFYQETRPANFPDCPGGDRLEMDQTISMEESHSRLASLLRHSPGLHSQQNYFLARRTFYTARTLRLSTLTRHDHRGVWIAPLTSTPTANFSQTHARANAAARRLDRYVQKSSASVLSEGKSFVEMSRIPVRQIVTRHQRS